ncbi:MAG: PKD domain-containing protein [Brevefilum sp.]|nr:PKD domain-containing protein [Brevefilum sp.]
MKAIKFCGSVIVLGLLFSHLWVSLQVSAETDPGTLFGEGSESPDQAVPAVQAAPDMASLDTLPMRPPFLVSDGYGYGFNPVLAYNSVRDEYLAVWGDPYNLHGRRVSSRGELLGAQFDISINALLDKDPSVAYDPLNDRYLVVWSRNITPATSDPYDKGNSDIYGRFIAWDGSAAAAAFAIDSSTSDSSFSPKVVYAAATQEYLVVWEDYVPTYPNYYSVRGRRIFAVGGGWPAKFLIASSATENRLHPAVAYNQVMNRYLVVFDNYNDSIYSTTNENIYGQRISGAGALLGGEFAIAGWPDDELVPAVSACPLSTFLVTWTSVQSGGKRVYARFVDFEGTPSSIVTQIESATTGSPFVPAALACKEYQLMAVWQKYGGGSLVGVSGRIAQFNETYEPIMEVAPPVYPHREKPAVACSSPNCLVIWEERNTEGYAEIYGRILGETKPKAAFTLTPTSGTSGSTFFMVDAIDSSDLEDAKVNLQVRWDWENDGIYDTAWSYTKSASHLYTIPCTSASVSRTIRLQVKDTYGLTDSTTKQITSIVNTAPTASFTVTPEIGPNTTAFYFDASGCSDVECLTSELQVRWDWENDGSWDTSWSYAKMITATFGSANYGFKTIKMEVKDGAGLTHSTTHTIKIDNPPTASFTVTPSSGDTTTIFQFDPSSSTDPDKPVQPFYHLSARWDWNNDGVWDTDWKMCWEVISHKFSTPGTYTVRLEVRESEPSLRDSTTRQVIVEQGSGLHIFLPLILK